MWISYNDSEVRKFHPICERALNEALIRIGQDDRYHILHHQCTGSLEMDFVIENKSTGKYLCVVEVKRTPADVHSTRYQFQAMSYVQMNAGQSEKPFYILTNLECAFSFRYDEKKPKAFQQMLEPGLTCIGSFKHDLKEIFHDKLTEYFCSRLGEFINGSYQYLLTLDNFASEPQQIKHNTRQWKSHLAVSLHEYIRGAFDFVKRKELRDIRLFGGKVASICEDAMQVNFRDIFHFSDETFERNISINSKTLSDLYRFGNQNISGDSIANILHQIVSCGHEHDGEVPTDVELARIVAELAKYSSGILSTSECICDPAAGSGNLISAAIPVYKLHPTQIIVNDVKTQLMELLSLRLGLNYPRTISSGNSVLLHNKNIADMKPEDFASVKVVLMNPPFVAGINCEARKEPLYTSINRLRGKAALTHIGQMPLEAVFLELLTELVQPGTTVACVFPKRHLAGTGPEAKIIRKLLLEQFGLHLIFTYPGAELFNTVTVDTCVLLGRTRQQSNKVKIISSYEKIPDIDFHQFAQSLHTAVSDDFTSIMPGMVAKEIPSITLANTINDGWRMLNREMVESIVFVSENFQNSEKFETLAEANICIKRGSVGNQGGSDLLFFDSRADLYNQYCGKNLTRSSGMRNASLDDFEVTNGDSFFLNSSCNSEEIIGSIINAYMKLQKREGKQKRKSKTSKEWKDILAIESRNCFPANCVLIPRAIRTKGRCYLSRTPIYVSTNFVVCSSLTPDEALIISTWMSTLFYQLICETFSKDQEGMRKMEVSEIKSTFIPTTGRVSQATLHALSNACSSIEFLNLSEPEIRNIDRIWAAELFGEHAETILVQARRLLKYLANRRNPKT